MDVLNWTASWLIYWLVNGRCRYFPIFNAAIVQKLIENLESEQATTVREKQELQKKQKTLDIIQQNFTALLDAPEINSDLLPAKRKPVSVTRDK